MLVLLRLDTTMAVSYIRKGGDSQIAPVIASEADHVLGSKGTCPTYWRFMFLEARICNWIFYSESD